MKAMQVLVLVLSMVLMYLGIAIMIGIVPVAGQGTIIVDDDGGAWANYTAIQDAIDNATSGDLIYVYEGLYNESLNVDVYVHLIGNGSDVTTIDAQGSGDTIYVGAGHVNITGFNITGSGTVSSDSGIEIDSNYVTVTECDITGNGNYGLYVNRQDGNVLTGLRCSYNENHGLHLERSGYNDIMNNNCSNNGGEGIYLRFNSMYNDIMNNTCSFNDNGIYLWFTSENNTLENNTCTNNNLNGIYIAHSDNNIILNNTATDNHVGINTSVSSIQDMMWNNCSHNGIGIELTSTYYCNITNNTISYNTLYGISLISSDYVNITYNEIFGNGDYGIYLGSDADFNSVHHNNIAWNNGSTSQGYDVTGNNNWTDRSEGNFWWDWNGTGAYPIDGGGSASGDEYPFDTPVETTAPEKIPALASLLMTMTSMLLVFALRRRS
jgi:parallel beta-helix repeat protein